jgi:CBS domain-containing protein
VKSPDQLTQAAEAVKRNGPVDLTARQLLGWYGFSRRGSWVVSNIRKGLKKLGVRTEPDFDSVWIDLPIKLVSAKDAKLAEPQLVINSADAAPTPKPENGGATPSHRIGRLKAANTKPVSVKPDDKLETAVTLMMTNDFSQLPVMTSERDVKGIISWRSIGYRLALKQKCEAVRDCMQPHHEVPDTASMFDVILLLGKYECVLVRDPKKIIAGIVTAADISEQFRLLSEPFLLLGDIENDLRRLIERAFSLDELKAARDPNDTARKVEGVSDLTFGEYLRLLGDPAKWEKLKIALDRSEFVKTLNQVREARNDVMHFGSDPLDDATLGQLRKFSAFLQTLASLTASLA